MGRSLCPIFIIFMGVAVRHHLQQVFLLPSLTGKIIFHKFSRYFV